MQGVAALGHVDDVLAMQGVVGDGAAHGLADAQAIGVVKEGGRDAGFGHLLQLAALFPGVGPGAVGERIADGIIGDGGAVVLGQLILPGGIVGVSDGLQHGANGAGGVGVALLVEDIAATVVFIGPGGAGGAGGGIGRIVDPNQLAQLVVDIGGLHAVPGDRSDIAYIIVSVGAGFAGLAHGGNEASGVAGAIAASQVGIGGGIGLAAHGEGFLVGSAEGIVSVGHLVVGITKGHESGLVFCSRSKSGIPEKFRILIIYY